MFTDLGEQKPGRDIGRGRDAVVDMGLSTKISGPGTSNG